MEDGHQVVFFDDELKNINGALLMQPLMTVPRLPNKVLPEMAERYKITELSEREERDLLPERPVSEVVTEPGHHHTDPVLLVGPVRVDLDEVVHHLPGQVHHAQAVLPPRVLRGRVDVVGRPQLSQATQSDNIL